MTAHYQIAVDVGGTFTDGVLLDNRAGPSGKAITVAKSLTTYDDPGVAVLQVIDQLVARAKLRAPAFSPSDVSRVVHGTTLITNTLIARQGVRTALITTAGMADCLDIGRELRYATYDLFLEYPTPLIEREDRFELDERLGPDGSVWCPLDSDQVIGIADKVAEGGFEAVAVCLLHACTNDAHERDVERILSARLPDVTVSVSSDVAREIGEYERMSTVAANAYVRPIVDRYIGRLQDKLSSAGLAPALDIMVSNGAFSTAEIACRTPIRLLESGPAGGVLSAVNCAAGEDIDRLLAFDMGGTTAKACVATDGRPAVTHVFEFGRVKRFLRGSGLPAMTPSIDLIEIGAGGGSIAAVNELGLLKVGPESAGSEPGPACYGLGGTAPTVTDADLLLGYLDPDAFLGGAMTLQPAAAEAALAALGERLGLSALETALGIHEIVNENMAAAARTHIAEKGMDARSFAMVATGGAGPVHAVDVAARLGIRSVICPIASGVGSCLGFLAAPSRADRSWTKVERLAEMDAADFARRLDQARRLVARDMAVCGVADRDVIWELAAEIRYVGQGARVEVAVPLSALDPEKVRNRFVEEYTRLFSHPVPGGVPEVVTWRIVGKSAQSTHRFDLFEASHGEKSLEPIGTRRVFLPHGKDFERVPVYDRYSLPVGAELSSPLILQEPESTLVVGSPGRVTITPSLSVKVDFLEREP